MGWDFVTVGGAGNANNVAFIKEGAGVLTFTNGDTVLTYKGNTTILNGTVEFQAGVVPQWTNSALTISSNGVLQLDDPAVTIQVATLVLNGGGAAAGIHNHSTDPTYLAGSGNLLVLAGPSNSTNAYLSGLVLSPAAALSPAFASNTFAYTASETYGSLLAVTVVNADLTATNHVTINGNALGIVASGVASTPAQALPANPAVPNTVTVQVTAQDGVTVHTYTVNVTQLPSQTPPAMTNSVGGGKLNLSWPLANLGYRLLEQTNNLNKGVSSNTNDWGTVANSTLTNNASISISNNILNKYYRLVYP
jgi:autotransporter-associated beta strand protein